MWSRDFILFFFNDFIYFWLCWGLHCCTGFFLVAVIGGYSLLRCTGFPLRWLLLWSADPRRSGFSSLWHVGSVLCSLALEHRLNSCGKYAWLFWGTWDLPGSGIKPVSHALAGRFFTIEPPGKPWSRHFKSLFCCCSTICWKDPFSPLNCLDTIVENWLTRDT